MGLSSSYSTLAVSNPSGNSSANSFLREAQAALILSVPQRRVSAFTFTTPLRSGVASGFIFFQISASVIKMMLSEWFVSWLMPSGVKSARMGTMTAP